MAASNSRPELLVTAQLPPVISFSSSDKPQLEVHVTLRYSQPIIIALKQSTLWPLHHCSALSLHHIGTGKEEYLPRIDAKTRGPPIPRLTQEAKDDFVGLRPGQTSVVRVSFRPYDEPYDYEKSKDKGVEKYRMMFPVGMQFLKPGEEYEIGIGQVQPHQFMVGDLNAIVTEADGAVWKPNEETAAVVAGEKCRFRVEA